MLRVVPNFKNDVAEGLLQHSSSVHFQFIANPVFSHVFTEMHKED